MKLPHRRHFLHLARALPRFRPCRALRARKSIRPGRCAWSPPLPLAAGPTSSRA